MDKIAKNRDTKKLDVRGMGSDEFSGAVVARIFLILIVCIPIILWSLINVPSEFNRCVIYALIGITSSIIIVFDKVIKKKEYIDTITEEPAEYRPSFFSKLSTKWILLIGIGISVFIAVRIATTGFSIVDAPRFQVAEFAASPLWRAFLSGLVGLIENSFFFGSIFPTLAIVFSARTRAFIGIPISIFASSLIFMGYHFLVYGTANVLASEAVLTFSIMNCIMVYVFRSLIVSDMWHFTNNFMLNLFEKVSVSPASLFM